MKNNVLQFPKRKMPHKAAFGVACAELLELPRRVILAGKIRNDVDFFEVKCK